jgi:hypothetical protein
MHVEILQTFSAIRKEFTTDIITKADLESPGIGKYPAKWFTDAPLPNMTVFAPKVPPPADDKMPVLVWGQGDCFTLGTASELYLIVDIGVEQEGEILRIWGARQFIPNRLLPGFAELQHEMVLPFPHF